MKSLNPTTFNKQEAHSGKDKMRIKWEWKRKLFHSSIGFLILILNRMNISQELVLKVLFP